MLKLLRILVITDYGIVSYQSAMINKPLHHRYYLIIHSNRVTGASSLFLSVLILFSVALITGCDSTERSPVPIDKMGQVHVPGIEDARTYWGDAAGIFRKDIEQSIEQEPPGYFLRDYSSGILRYPVLSLSGGGANGAFGAGILCGWSESGQRPLFKLVTGVSTGALIAPLAFLGSEYDDQLKAYYTEVQTEDVIKFRFFNKLVWGESIADSGPLANIIARDADRALLDKIALEHSKGRRLYIGTTDLDSQRFVIWNMGRIASSDHPDAVKLFRDIILASASVPVVFPPVYVKVEADGVQYDEMHVDGAVRTQFFSLGAFSELPQILLENIENPESIKSFGQLYIIRNGTLSPEPTHIDPKISSIAPRTISTLVKSSSINDLFRLFAFAKRDKLEFNYMAIPDNYEFRGEGLFDSDEMNRLFQLGYKMGKSDQSWINTPPGFSTDVK